MDAASKLDIGTSARADWLALAASLSGRRSPPSLIGRLLIAAIFLISGVGRIAAPAMTTGYIASMGQPFPTMAFVLAVVIELGGGLLRVLGLRTRVTALALAMIAIADRRSILPPAARTSRFLVFDACMRRGGDAH